MHINKYKHVSANQQKKKGRENPSGFPILGFKQSISDLTTTLAGGRNNIKV